MPQLGLLIVSSCSSLLPGAASCRLPAGTATAAANPQPPMAQDQRRTNTCISDSYNTHGFNGLSGTRRNGPEPRRSHDRGTQIKETAALISITKAAPPLLLAARAAGGSGHERLAPALAARGQHAAAGGARHARAEARGAAAAALGAAQRVAHAVAAGGDDDERGAALGARGRQDAAAEGAWGWWVFLWRGG
jgi:hypothetical protein